jgi:hypothetical protein
MTPVPITLAEIALYHSKGTAIRMHNYDDLLL